jgi:hypothetical protein
MAGIVSGHPNPNYPGEEYGVFVAGLIEKKKKRIVFALDVLNI